MDLKDFVKETLVQISSGVKDAQDDVRALGGYANPAARVQVRESDSSHLAQIGGGQNVFMIDFDVAISVIEESEAGAEAKLKVASFLSLGGGGTVGSSSSSTNRISFKVPLALPVDTESKKRMLQKEEDASRKIAEANASLRIPDAHTPDW
ncbi:MAG: hypothetical protein KZQ89_19125 [Candidatus Thiodiazotropha sp. (ex Lucinoma kastoroae)]|nr:hypothetical protein [Candidatus Thiodiazotropha sp. (ex Lucinoma kastoroae)]